MQTSLECIPCFLKQALDACELAGADDKMKKQVIDRLCMAMPDVPLEHTPPQTARLIHRIVREVTGKTDYYAQIKEKSNRIALGLLKSLHQTVAKAPDPLFCAIELAIAGNIIDFGIKNSDEIEKRVKQLIEQEQIQLEGQNRAIFDLDGFVKRLDESKEILWLGDNAGETVFDRVLAQNILLRDPGKRITYAVRSKPIINDALLEDARTCGMDLFSTLMESGSDAPGTVLELCTPEFQDRFNSADMVISKGQGNFESLSCAGREIFFLFMAKCPVIVKDINRRFGPCRLGDINLVHYKGQNA